MKTLTAAGLLLMCLSFTSCEVESIDPVAVIQPHPFQSQRDTATFKTGRYSGESRLIIPGQVDITNPAYLELFQCENLYVVRWWTSPDTVSLAAITDTLRYVMTYDRTNTSCGLQRSIYDCSVTTIRKGDSVFESGAVRYRWYYEGNLIKDLPGSFTVKLKYIDKLTPNKNL